MIYEFLFYIKKIIKVIYININIILIAIFQDISLHILALSVSQSLITKYINIYYYQIY